MKPKPRAALFAFGIAFIMLASALAARSEEADSKYTDLEKQQVSDESQKELREYYGDLLPSITTARFNTIAAKENIAIINVTIEGKDRRILTRLRNGWLFPGQFPRINESLVTVKNLAVLGNISLKGLLYSDIDTAFGPRRFFGVEATGLRYLDSGYSRLFDGKANISINPVLREIIGSYDVFLTPNSLTKGIYVSEKTPSYFIVKGVNPLSNIAFSWLASGAGKIDEGNLKSLEKEISITATIDMEKGAAEIKVLRQPGPAAALNSSNSSNETSSGSPITVTGSIILETNLSGIMGNATIAPENPAGNFSLSGESPPSDNSFDVLEFNVSSISEDEITSQAASAAGLSLEQARKSISFIYKEPENPADEKIEEMDFGWIRNVNGSVIVTIG